MGHVSATEHPLRRRSDRDPLLGSLVERRYRITRRIGEGATGPVYRARAQTVARRAHGHAEVALKTLTLGCTGEDVVARFVHEAYLGSRIDHPNLLPVVDFGRVADGRPYHVTPLCGGATLRRVLATAGALSPTLACSLLDDAAAGLTYLHDHGVVHRDVKPSNLFVVMGDGRWPTLRVLDLGAASVFDATRARLLGIEDAGGAVYGTPAYLAPEQALGHAVDARADVYALGCVAYRMLTGCEPHRCGTIEELVRAHLFDEPRPASAANRRLPEAVDDVFRGALAKRRDDRIASVIELAASLSAALD